MSLADEKIDLKIQLVHPFVLADLDYCNAAYGSLSEANIYKLQIYKYFILRVYFYSLSRLSLTLPVAVNLLIAVYSLYYSVYTNVGTTTTLLNQYSPVPRAHAA